MPPEPDLRVVGPSAPAPTTATALEGLAPDLHIDEDDEGIGTKLDAGDANRLQTEQTTEYVGEAQGELLPWVGWLAPPAYGCLALRVTNTLDMKSYEGGDEDRWPALHPRRHVRLTQSRQGLPGATSGGSPPAPRLAPCGRRRLIQGSDGDPYGI